MTEHKTGISFLGLLGIVFITLKLTSVIDWSWWLVLLPIYGPIVFAVFVMVACGFLGWLIFKVGE